MFCKKAFFSNFLIFYNHAQFLTNWHSRIFKIQWFPLSILIFWSKILLFRTHHLYNSTTELILMSTLELYQPKPAQVSNYFFLKRVHHRTFLERLSLEISVRPNIMGWNPIRSKYGIGIHSTHILLSVQCTYSVTHKYLKDFRRSLSGHGFD